MLVLSLRVPSGHVAAEYQFVARIFLFFGNQKQVLVHKIIIEIKFMSFIYFLPNDDEKKILNNYIDKAKKNPFPKSLSSRYAILYCFFIIIYNCGCIMRSKCLQLQLV